MKKISSDIKKSFNLLNSVDETIKNSIPTGGTTGGDVNIVNNGLPLVNLGDYQGENDTQKFQSCLDDLNKISNGDGGTIVIPPGNYMIDTALDTKSMKYLKITSYYPRRLVTDNTGTDERPISYDVDVITHDIVTKYANYILNRDGTSNIAFSGTDTKVFSIGDNKIFEIENVSLVNTVYVANGTSQVTIVESNGHVKTNVENCILFGIEPIYMTSSGSIIRNNTLFVLDGEHEYTIRRNGLISENLFILMGRTVSIRMQTYVTVKDNANSIVGLTVRDNTFINTAVQGSSLNTSMIQINKYVNFYSNRLRFKNLQEIKFLQEDHSNVYNNEIEFDNSVYQPMITDELKFSIFITLRQSSMNKNNFYIKAPSIDSKIGIKISLNNSSLNYNNISLSPGMLRRNLYQWISFSQADLSSEVIFTGYADYYSTSGRPELFFPIPVSTHTE